MLLTPTVSTPPPGIGELAPTYLEQQQLRILGLLGSGHLFKVLGLLDEVAKNAFDFTPWTPVCNVTGQPAMSVPLHWDPKGLPIGVHLVSNPPSPRSSAILTTLVKSLMRANGVTAPETTPR